MKHISFNFTTADNLTLFGRVWLSTNAEIKGVVNLVHGIGEHSGRYDHIGEGLNAAGYHLAAFDLRGHGLSEGKRGFSPSLNHLMDDIELFLSESQSQIGNGYPKFLYGHSLGANLVLNFGVRRKPQISGVIAPGPSFALAFDPPKIKLFLGKILAKLLPSFTMSNELDTTALARDEAVVKAYRDDVYVHDKISARLTMDILESGQYGLDHAQAWTLPLLLMHGTADRITSHKATQQFAEKGNGSIDLVLFDNYYHEIHNDIGKEKVVKQMIDWLDVTIAN